MKKRSCIKNGKKGGRPKSSIDKRMVIPEIELTILSPEQYLLLIEKYGFELINKALRIFENWLQGGGPEAEKYIGKNNYAHFRSDGWVINLAKHG